MAACVGIRLRCSLSGVCAWPVSAPASIVGTRMVNAYPNDRDERTRPGPYGFEPVIAGEDEVTYVISRDELGDEGQCCAPPQEVGNVTFILWVGPTHTVVRTSGAKHVLNWKGLRRQRRHHTISTTAQTPLGWQCWRCVPFPSYHARSLSGTARLAAAVVVADRLSAFTGILSNRAIGQIMPVTPAD